MSSNAQLPQIKLAWGQQQRKGRSFTKTNKFIAHTDSPCQIELVLIFICLINRCTSSCWYNLMKPA